MSDIIRSKDGQIKEIIKCGKDPIHFMNAYVKIQHPKKGLIPFNTYEFQDRCVDDFRQHRFNIILKSRQLGLSTVTAAYAVWMAIFYKEKNILVIATKQKTAVNIIKKVKVMIASLPKWLMLPSITTNNNQTLAFNNGSQIQAVARSEDAGRSEALSLLIIDEAAFIQGFDQIWTGLSPTLSTGGSAILISTPNGVGNQYHKLWVDAEAGVNKFNPIKLPWNVHPEHDQEWFDAETRGSSKKLIEQEFLCSFFGSGETYLQTPEVEWLHNNIREPIRKDNECRDVWVWKEPIPGHNYVLSGDAARGDSKDFSTFHIIDTVDCEVVAEFKGMIPPDQFGDLMNKWGLQYNKALICPENNTYGFTACQKLKILKYPRLYYQNQHVYTYDTIPPEDGVPGFSTQAKSRMLVLAKLEELIRNKVLKIYSQRFFDEVQTFTFVNGRAQALKGYNDDLILSLAIGGWIIDTVVGYSTNNNFMDSALIANMSTTSRTMDQAVPQINQVQPLYGAGISTYSYGRTHNSQVASTRNPMLNDYSWLIK